MHMTEANSRMARLETDPVLREEAETIRIMTAMYCRARPGPKGTPAGKLPEERPYKPITNKPLR